MNRLLAALLVVAVFEPANRSDRTIDLTRYFASPAAEAQSRTRVLAQVRTFEQTSVPRSAGSLATWLERYDRLLVELERHDIFVYLRAEQDDRDTRDAAADDALSTAEQGLHTAIERAAAGLGAARIASLTAHTPTSAFRFLLQSALDASAHHGPDAATVALETTEAKYKALRRSKRPFAGDQDAYAALLISTVSGRDEVARRRGFRGAPEASYFDKGLSPQSVRRAIESVRSSGALAHLRAVETHRPKTAFAPAPISIERASSLILEAETPVGGAFEREYAAFLSPQQRRLEICTEAHCDATGFSLGFSEVTSAAFFGDYDGSVDSARAVAHEVGHAVHRELMNLHQPIAAYNEGPHFMYESFAIFSELLFLDHLYRSARSRAERAYYLDAFLDDAVFQVYGSAAETDLENAIYRGVRNGSLKSGAGFDALAARTMARYDPRASSLPATRFYWIRDRLFYTDPLYDVNYLYAGLLALRYLDDFERDRTRFSKRYIALLENGFTDTPAALERRFVGIDLDDEASLVAGADRLIEARTTSLKKLYG